MSLEELPEGAPRMAMMPVDTDGCSDLDDVCGRLSILERVEQLRREEDARMAERFSYIQGALGEIKADQAVDHALIIQTRDVALQNNHDLNNGLKSTVKAIVRKVGALDASFVRHQVEDCVENRKRLIREVNAEDQKAEKATKHRTIEIWIGVFGSLVVMRELGVVGWIVSLLR